MSLAAKEIRKLLKDKPELNILLEYNVQSDDPLVNSAITMAVSEFNSVPPMSQYTEANFPNIALLFYGVAHYLANGEAERQLRNQVNYNAQGLNAEIDGKYAQYHQLAQYYYQLFMQKSAQYKQFLNNEEAWGHVTSPYARLNESKYGS